MVESFIAQASSYAANIDFVFTLVTVLVGFWFLLAEGMFFWLIWRFRASANPRSEHITGDEKHLKRWVTIPHLLVLVCDLFIIYFAVTVWIEVKQSLPPADATVRVVGQQWAWTFDHPGPDGRLDTPDDIRTSDELHVEVDKIYHFELSSKDVLHSFSVPVFRLKQDAIPGRIIKGWFKPTVAGEYDIQCAEICGMGHGMMFGRIHVETAAAHQSWLATNAGLNPAVAATAMTTGE